MNITFFRFRPNKKLAVLLFFILFFSLHSQNKKDSVPNNFYSMFGPHKSFGIVGGLGQFKFPWMELGVANAKWKTGCVFGSYWKAQSFSVDWSPYVNVGGINLTAWQSGGMLPISVGINLNSYTDFKQKYCTGVKLMAGIGLQEFQIVYSYNFVFFDQGVRNLDAHRFTFRYFIPLRTKLGYKEK